MSSKSMRQLEKLQDQLNRLDPKGREVCYLSVDPVLMAQAKALMDGALPEQTKTKNRDEDSSEEPS